MLEQIPPKQQEQLKRLVGISAASMVFMAALLLCFSAQIVEMSGLGPDTVNIIAGLLLFIAITDLLLIKFIFKDTDRR